MGIVGNQGEVTADAASKGAHFVTLCNERQIPLVFLQNTWPESMDKESGNMTIYLLFCRYVSLPIDFYFLRDLKEVNDLKKIIWL